MSSLGVSGIMSGNISLFYLLNEGAATTVRRVILQPLETTEVTFASSRSNSAGSSPALSPLTFQVPLNFLFSTFSLAPHDTIYYYLAYSSMNSAGQLQQRRSPFLSFSEQPSTGSLHNIALQNSTLQSRLQSAADWYTSVHAHDTPVITCSAVKLVQTIAYVNYQTADNQYSYAIQLTPVPNAVSGSAITNSSAIKIDRVLVQLSVQGKQQVSAEMNKM